jgi:hypothetical protein
MKRTNTRRRGATLLEALFCLAILALVLPAMLGTAGRQARSARVLEGRVEARALIEATAQTLRRARFPDLVDLVDPSPVVVGPVPLPPVPEGFTRELEVGRPGGPAADALCEVTVRVSWKVGGRAGEPPRDHVLERHLLVADRTHSLRFDGVVGS